MNRSKKAGRVDVDADQCVGCAAPSSAPVGDGHAAGQRAGQLDVDRRGPGLHQIRVQCHRGGQRIVQMGQIGFARASVQLAAVAAVLRAAMARLWSSIGISGQAGVRRR